MHPLDYEIKRVRLTITEKCNLRCEYCFEYNKNYKTISLENAKKVVESELSSTLMPFKRVIIDLFGGEPFVEFNLLRELCEYIWNKTWKVEYMFWVTTNGTLITDDVEKWLRANSHRISCGLSLDGDRDVHNKNRYNSFEHIPVDFFANMWPSRPVRSVICPNTVDSLYDSVLYLHQHFSKIKNRLAWGIDWDNEKIDFILEEQLRRLVEFYKNNPDVSVCSMLDIDLRYLLPQHKVPQICGVGFNHVAYDVFGVKYPCAQFQSLCHDGVIEYNAIAELDFQNRKEYLTQKCLECKLRDICQTCYAHCFTHYQEKTANCRTFKLIVKYATILKKWKLEQEPITKYNLQLINLCEEIIFEIG